jgi:3-deoxy-D-arabino-heptulosonate 7-phosphate (DAHP) synthase
LKSKNIGSCCKPELTSKKKKKRRTTFQSKEEKKEIILTKHRKKCKNNTSMNLMAEGPCTHCDESIMTKKGTTEADGK